MAMRIVQLAFDRLISDVGIAVLKFVYLSVVSLPDC